MEQEKRASCRVKVLCRMKIYHDSFGEKEVNTRDVSDDGLFLLLDSEILPPMGTVIQGQLLGSAGPQALLNLEIVRCEETGAGFKVHKSAACLDLPDRFKKTEA
ncbi:PilZ domain-containing protein [uncultured Pseudoteredinibacter sp.]|uniref:PilZ domain-containing protein n=1 Tax=uncultured Pseudoteredinibacter sp. TaxID=1641701 RepID=UPI002614721E|nr:PilZ domain-containing protein [uncultured Pseudoteredinibacter sp.]